MKKILISLIISVYHFFSPATTLSSTLPLSTYQNVVPVAIIGSGVTGLGAAQSAAKRGYHTIVFQGAIPRGGLNFDSQLTDWLGIMSASGKDIMQNMEQQAVNRGAILMPTAITQVDFSEWPFILKTEDGITVRALSVVIATGTAARKLTVPGAAEYEQKGVAMDIKKNDTHWRGKHVVIIGSGDDAFKKAERLKQLKAAKITILVRGESMKIDPKDFNTLLNSDNVIIHYNTTIVSITGDGNWVEQITVHTKNGQEVIFCDGVAVAIGTFPATELFSHQLEIGQNDEIIVKPMSQNTSIDGVMAGGTCVDPRYRKGFISAADGLKAGYDATDFLRNRSITPESLKLIENNFLR